MIDDRGKVSQFMKFTFSKDTFFQRNGNDSQNIAILNCWYAYCKLYEFTQAIGHCLCRKHLSI